MSSKFITEAEIEEKRKLRQLEWDKVRQPEDPEEAPEAPEEPVDHRSLYDRLKEQKDKKQEEFEEAHKLKNLVKVLDDDEVDFLDYVDKAKMDEERRKRLEEAKELSEFRNQVAILREKEIEQHIKNEIGLNLSEVTKVGGNKNTEETVSIGSKRTSQTKLLAGIVKRKLPSSTEEPGVDIKKQKPGGNQETATNSQSSGERSSSKDVIESVPYKGNLVCIGVLPGLASYSNSSDEENSDSDHASSDSEDDIAQVKDLCGRRIMSDELNTKKETK